MRETLFAFHQQNYRECQSAYRGPHNQEYFIGDYSIEPGPTVDVRADRQVVGCCSIINLRSTCRIVFGRSWSHIRADRTDVTVLWFIKRGWMRVSFPGGQSVAREGELLVTNSVTPFVIEHLPDNDYHHQVIHLVIPSHVLSRFIPHRLQTGVLIATDGRETVIAKEILMNISEGVGDLSEQSREILLHGTLSLLGDAIPGLDRNMPNLHSARDRRYQEIIRFLAIHFSDPDLNATTIAKACKVSRRYLTFLLHGYGTTFSSLLWEKRMEAATEWLSKPKSADLSVGAVAYRVGFKSPAHFSRMFKRMFNMTPGEYRASRVLTSLSTPSDINGHEQTSRERERGVFPYAHHTRKNQAVLPTDSHPLLISS